MTDIPAGRLRGDHRLSLSGQARTPPALKRGSFGGVSFVHPVSWEKVLKKKEPKAGEGTRSIGNAPRRKKKKVKAHLRRGVSHSSETTEEEFIGILI